MQVILTLGLYDSAWLARGDPRQLWLDGQRVKVSNLCCCNSWIRVPGTCKTGTCYPLTRHHTCCNKTATAHTLPAGLGMHAGMSTLTPSTPQLATAFRASTHPNCYPSQQAFLQHHLQSAQQPRPYARLRNSAQQLRASATSTGAAEDVLSWLEARPEGCTVLLEASTSGREQAWTTTDVILKDQVHL